jgi:hypothetical protein
MRKILFLFFIGVVFNPISTKFGYSFSYLVKASWNSPISFCDKKSAAMLLSYRGCIYICLHKAVHIIPVTERFKKGRVIIFRFVFTHFP